jgi:2-hydroxychromene-2-carboxylate isomerase
MSRFEFFYDFVSPYSYLASTRVEGVSGRTGVPVRFRPFLLGGVFKATGNRAPIEVEAKGKHMWSDLQRWAKRLSVPLARPPTFPISTVLALRVALQADDLGKLVPFTHAAFRAYWAESRDLSAPEVVTEVASSVGLDGPALVAAAPAQRDRLMKQTQEAIDRGAFGAPTFFVGDELFVGNDRLDFVEEALRRGA